jgi:peptidoglycan/LPS O-acetylase OafA/YrhL
MSHSSRHAPVPLIDLGKALASQLIVWHHLAFYSPMRRVVDPLAPALFDWLADSARLAVQLFLVMAGFLAARSLMPDPQRQTATSAWRYRPCSPSPSPSLRQHWPAA